MIARLFRLLGIDLATLDVVVVPLDQWHRVFERLRVAEARVAHLEAALAAVEQSRE